jgi:hypothetical protein
VLRGGCHPVTSVVGRHSPDMTAHRTSGPARRPVVRCCRPLGAAGRRRWSGRLARHPTYGLRSVVEPQLGRFEFPVMNERLGSAFMTQFGRRGGCAGIAVPLARGRRPPNPSLLRAGSRSVVTFRGPPLYSRVSHDDLSVLCFQC